MQAHRQPTALAQQQQSKVPEFTFRKLLMVVLIIALWTGLDGIISYGLFLLAGEKATEHNKVMYTFGMVIVCIFLVYILNISPALIV